MDTTAEPRSENNAIIYDWEIVFKRLNKIIEVKDGYVYFSNRIERKSAVAPFSDNIDHTIYKASNSLHVCYRNYMDHILILYSWHYSSNYYVAKICSVTTSKHDIFGIMYNIIKSHLESKPWYGYKQTPIIQYVNWMEEGRQVVFKAIDHKWLTHPISDVSFEHSVIFDGELLT